MGRRMTYVQKREKTGGYYYRRPIGLRLRPFMAAPYTGKTEVYFSLKTKNPAEAEHRAKIVDIDRMFFDAERAAKTHGKWALSDTSRVGSWLTLAWANTAEVIEDGGVPIPPFPTHEPPRHSTQGAPVTKASGHRFADVAEEYLRGRKLPGKTEHDWRRYWRLFSELTGFDLSGDIGAITKDDARKYKDLLLRFPSVSNGKTYEGKTAPQIIETADMIDAQRKADAQRSQKAPVLVSRYKGATITKGLSALSAVCKYAVNAGYVDNNPFTGVGVDLDDQDDREPFTPAQLQNIFSGEWFQDGRWGSNQWIVALSLYTGFRLEELGKLRYDDIINGAAPGDDEELWYISLTKTNGRSLKTKASKRRMPIHRDLVEIGFLAFCDSRRSEEWLFDLKEYTWKGDLRRTHYLSKEFGRYLRKLGMGSERVFHSFRHLFKDVLRDSEVELSAQMALLGHTEPGTGALYGSGHGLRTLCRAMNQVRMPIRVRMVPASAA